MKPILKQIAELIGGAIRELRQSIEPRLKSLEGSQEALALTTRSAEERLIGLVDDRIKSFHEAMLAREALQNDLTGQLKALLQERSAVPPVEVIVRQVVQELRGADETLVARCKESALALIHQWTTEYQAKFLTLAAAIQELPTVEAIAAKAAGLVEVPPAPDLKGFATHLEVQANQELMMEQVELLKDTLSKLPTLDQVAARAVTFVPAPKAPDLSGLVTEAQVRALDQLVTERIAGLHKRVDELPSTDEVARKAAALVSVPAAPDLSGLATKEELDLLTKQVSEDNALAAGITKSADALFKQLDNRISKVELAEPPDVSGFLKADQVKELITEDRVRFAVAPVTPVEVARAALELLPAPLNPSDVAKAAAALIPAPKDGESFTLQQVQDLVAKAVALVPLPTAEQVAGSLDATHLSKWALDFERRAQDLLQRCVDRMPTPKDGVDGMGFEDMTVEYDGNRTFTFAMVRDARRKAFEFKVPVMIYRGIFNEASSYDKGDVATWGGSSWVALKDSPQGKPGQSRDWQLIVKKGTDGRDK